MYHFYLSQQVKSFLHEKNSYFAGQCITLYSQSTSPTPYQTEELDLLCALEVMISVIMSD